MDKGTLFNYFAPFFTKKSEIFPKKQKISVALYLLNL